MGNIVCYLQSQVTETPFIITFADMVYLGEAKFGIRTSKERLDWARTAKTRNKYALNVLELLISKEECANSLWGGAWQESHAQGKKEGFEK